MKALCVLRQCCVADEWTVETVSQIKSSQVMFAL